LNENKHMKRGHDNIYKGLIVPNGHASIFYGMDEDKRLADLCKANNEKAAQREKALKQNVIQLKQQQQPDLPMQNPPLENNEQQVQQPQVQEIPQMSELDKALAKIKKLEDENKALKEDSIDNQELEQIIQANKDENVALTEKSLIKDNLIKDKDNLIKDKDNLIKDKDNLIKDVSKDLIHSKEIKATQVAHIQELQEDKSNLKIQVNDWKDVAKAKDCSIEKLDNDIEQLQLKLAVFEDKNTDLNIKLQDLMLNNNVSDNSSFMQIVGETNLVDDNIEQQ